MIEWIDFLFLLLLLSPQVSIFANQTLGLLFPVTTIPELLISLAVPSVTAGDPICFFDAGVQDFPGKSLFILSFHLLLETNFTHTHTLLFPTR